MGADSLTLKADLNVLYEHIRASYFEVERSNFVSRGMGYNVYTA
jgi:hypothetical protein